MHVTCTRASTRNGHVRSYPVVIITCVRYLGPPGPFSFPDSRDLLEVLGGLSWHPVAILAQVPHRYLLVIHEAPHLLRPRAMKLSWVAPVIPTCVLAGTCTDADFPQDLTGKQCLLEETSKSWGSSDGALHNSALIRPLEELLH